MGKFMSIAEKRQYSKRAYQPPCQDDLHDGAGDEIHDDFLREIVVIERMESVETRKKIEKFMQSHDQIG